MRRRWRRPSPWATSLAMRPMCLKWRTGRRDQRRAFGLGSLQLGDAHGEPLHALVAEVHLNACIAALAFGVDDDAGPELRMHYVLADAEPTGVTRFLEHGFLLFCRSPDELPSFGKARRQPLHEPLGDLLEEARRDVVARLAVQQAGLRVREVQAMA